MASLSDVQIAALKVVGAILLVAAVGVGLLLYDGTREAAEVAELRELAAGGGRPAASARSASLWVNASPLGATVLVDGDSVGTIPLWLESLAAGEHRVEVVDRGVTVADTFLVVASGEMAELEFGASAAREPAPTDAVEIAEPPAAAAPPAADWEGHVRITSDPSNALVLLDGRRMGRTPLSLSGVRPGQRAFTVSKEGYEPTVHQIDVRPGVQFEASVDLRPRAAAPPRLARTERPVPQPAAPAEPPAPGTVEILVRPWGQIVIDGEVRQRESDVVYRTQLPAGSHQVRVSHPQLGTSERTVTVQPGGVSRIEFDLARTQRED